MRTVVFFLGLIMGSVTWAQNLSEEYYTIKGVRVTEVAEEEVSLLRDSNFADCDGNLSHHSSSELFENPLDQINVMIDQIINIGKKIWNLIEQGRPVVNIKVDKAHALPRGIKCWTDLAGWDAPKSKSYRIDYINGFNSPV
ncbi:MAG: hypothetical protein N2Z70_07190, partial [Bdellovibrionaceae bacterium]|nr:hypothetical protein [Pseudobdellovibrionaceae bacterium]